MSILKRPAIYTDYYELSMAQGYFLAGRTDETATFDYFFRKNPYKGGFVIFAGLSDLLELLHEFRFRDDELEYLKTYGFRDEFLEFLRDFRFQATLYAATEGEIVFPFEPVVRVEGSLIETQIIESLLLNILNFESLIATKAARIRQVAGNKLVSDFGLRRSQGFGGILASKASIIGGLDSTSNVYSAFKYDLKATGTMAHSWIQSFEDELTAFRKFAEYYPDQCILLVDTYDTLKSGVPNAIKVGKELEAQGHQLKGIRLDSGDLAYFSRESRKMLDEAGLDYVKIAASNQLDEHLIKSLMGQEAPIDLFGVGTRLVTGYDSPALDGVYKLSTINQEPKLKISENVEKITLPGFKKVVRLFNGDDMFYGDGIFLDDENEVDTIYHPHYPNKYTEITRYRKENLHQKVMENGEIYIELPKAKESAQYAGKRMKKLRKDHKRFENPHVYKVGISRKLMNLRDKLVNKEK